LIDHVANGMFHGAATRMESAFEARVRLLHLAHRYAKRPPFVNYL